MSVSYNWLTPQFIGGVLTYAGYNCNLLAITWTREDNSSELKCNFQNRKVFTQFFFSQYYLSVFCSKKMGKIFDHQFLKVTARKSFSIEHLILKYFTSFTSLWLRTEMPNFSINFSNSDALA
jgi:hypothetical protein